jgi:hypothetical protein
MKKSLENTAEALAQIMMEHLGELAPEDRKARIKAGKELKLTSSSTGRVGKNDLPPIPWTPD